MKHEFKVGDHVEWNSEAGRVRGTIRQKVTAPMKFKTYTVRASKEVPQYMIKSDTTDHLAMHKGAALKKIAASATRHQSGPRVPKQTDLTVKLRMEPDRSASGPAIHRPEAIHRLGNPEPGAPVGS